MKPYRVLHLPGEMTRGGVESLIMLWYRNIDHDKIQFDFCVPRFERGPLDDEIESYGGKIFHCHRIREKGVLSFISEVISIIKENGPYDAVHIHGVHSGVFSLIASKRARVPKRIYHSHSTQNLVLRNNPLRKVQEGLFSMIINRYATIRLACSRPAGLFVFRDYPFTIVNNGIDLDRFKPYSDSKRIELRTHFQIPKDAIVIGNVARFVEGKNQDIIAAIIKKGVKEHNIPVFGLFVGDGPKRDSVASWCEEHLISQYVCFTGNRSDTEALYNCMDVFCLPSDFEGLGIVAIEAQACGIPCLVSTEVPDEANMQCIPFEKKSLNDSIEEWLSIVENLAKTKRADSTIIKTAITNHGYSLESCLDAIVNIYLN